MDLNMKLVVLQLSNVPLLERGMLGEHWNLGPAQKGRAVENEKASTSCEFRTSSIPLQSSSLVDKRSFVQAVIEIVAVSMMYIALKPLSPGPSQGSLGANVRVEFENVC